MLRVSAEQANESHTITDNSIKYIISETAIRKICRASEEKRLTKRDVWEIIRACGDNPYNYRGIENDMVAFIRNERQILYYYGYFHSKAMDAKGMEFSSLTPIGELALDANFYEFLAIWEHQKIKMISQAPTETINNVSGQPDGERFAVGYTPYTDILGHIVRNGELSLREYKYIVSRRTRRIGEADWVGAEKEILRHIGDIQAHIEAFGRRRDIADEDCRKELLKYMLGVRADLPFDGESSPLGAVECRQGVWAGANAGKLQFLFDIYSRLEEYKIQKYGELFRQCEEDLKKRYIGMLQNERLAADPHVKIDWDLYNIRMDRFILLSVIETVAAACEGRYAFEGAAKEIAAELLPAVNERFSRLLKKIGLKTETAWKRELQTALQALQSRDYTPYKTAPYEERAQVLALYREESTEALQRKIVHISREAATAVLEGRTRNATLIGLLKSYYMARYLEGGLLKCECCGETTFLTNAGEPYVEFHHLIPFHIAEGPDHYLNLFALCPNCHRKIHYLKVRDKKEQYQKISDNNYLHLCLEKRLRRLREERVLRSYHLEYLLAENAITQEEYDRVAG